MDKNSKWMKLLVWILIGATVFTVFASLIFAVVS